MEERSEVGFRKCLEANGIKLRWNLDAKNLIWIAVNTIWIITTDNTVMICPKIKIPIFWKSDADSAGFSIIWKKKDIEISWVSILIPIN